MTSFNPIKSFTFMFHDETFNNLLNFEEEEEEKKYKFNISSYKFGILKLEMDSIPISSRNLDIQIVTDMSGSMDIEDKMIISNHTIKNFMKILSSVELTTNIRLGIIGFDDKIHLIQPFTKVTTENFIKMQKNVDQNLQPAGFTNLENPLKEIQKIFKEEDEYEKCVILLTDGDITKGERSHDILSQLVNKNYVYKFIGFGCEHNSLLLQKLSNYYGGSNHFISNIEESPIAFSEIIYELLYPGLNHVSFTIENGEIYDSNTNTWTTTIKLYCIVSEVIRSFHIRTTNYIDDVKIKMKIENEEKDFAAIKSENKINLNYFQHRQIVLSSLYLAKYNNTNLVYKKEIKQFLIYLKKFMELNQLTTNVDYKILCDDLHILYETIGTNKSDMYIHARWKSQSNQSSYQITDIIGVIKQENDKEDEQNIPHKLLKQLSSNTSPTIKQLMRETSQEDNSCCNLLLEKEDLLDKEDYLYLCSPPPPPPLLKSINNSQMINEEENYDMWFKMTVSDYQKNEN